MGRASFTLVYVRAAARPRRAKVLDPILDILQSIPILVFLPIPLTFFIQTFPDNLLGLEISRNPVTDRTPVLKRLFSHHARGQPAEG